MPAGISHALTGYASFAAIKLAGYTLAAWVLRKIYGQARAPVIVVGLARTALGMLAGMSFFKGIELAKERYDLPVDSIFYYLAGLILLRIMEWWLTVWFFYDRELTRKQKDWTCVFGGIAWSFFLDVPAALGFIATGGVSIC